MFLLKPIEQGFDIRITGGIHTGCLRLQAGVNTDIHKVEDLRGKRIGISNVNNPPYMFASRVFEAHGIDAKNEKEIRWLTYPNDVMELCSIRGRLTPWRCRADRHYPALRTKRFAT